MSGRLVILPHKSWNVWNQDNREKVARDERLHREAEAAKAENEKRLIQEQNLSILRSDVPIIKTEQGNLSSSEVEPFRLFEDLEKKYFEKIGNEDYLIEKAAKELLQKKRDGIADWALGEGSYENSKSKPWYEKIGDYTEATTSQPAPSSSSSRKDCHSSKTPTSFIQREELRKHIADPMGVILVPNKHDYQPKTKETSAITDVVWPECAAIEAAEGKEREDEDVQSHSSSSSIERHSNKHKKRKHKRDDREGQKRKKKSSKHSHKRHNKTAASPENFKSNSNRNTNLTGMQLPATGSSKPESSICWQELREKRLERERMERSRAAQLLAQTDIYGPSSSSSAGGGYSSQYHPHLARNYNVGSFKR